MDGNKLAHLQMVQVVIERMAGCSFQIRGWSVLVLTSIFVLSAATMALRPFTLLAVFPCVAFWILDGFYLYQERCFRRLYDHVRSVADPTDFTMNTSVATGEESWLEATFSKTMLVFHGGILAATFLVSYLLIKQGG